MNITPNEIKKIVSEVADRYKGAVISTEEEPNVTRDGSHKITVQKFHFRFTLFGYDPSQFNLIFTLVKSTKNMDPGSWDCSWTFAPRMEILASSGAEYSGILDTIEEIVGILDNTEESVDDNTAFSDYNHPVRHSPAEKKLKDKKNKTKEVERKPMFS